MVRREEFPLSRGYGERREGSRTDGIMRTMGNQGGGSPPGGDRHPGAEALHSTEGHILLAGIALALLGLASLSLCALFDPRIAQILAGITATNVLFGRAAGMSLSYAFGLGHTAAMLLNMLIETILVLLFYPVFVFSLIHLLSFEWLKRLVDRTAAAALRHQDKVRRYGVPGLMFFVFFPFSMTGPMVGCVIGHMIGLGALVNVAVVLAGTYFAILCWGLLLRDMLERLALYSTYAPTAAVAVTLALMILAYFIRMLRGRGRDRRRG